MTEQIEFEQLIHLFKKFIFELSFAHVNCGNQTPFDSHE